MTDNSQPTDPNIPVTPPSTDQPTMPAEPAGDGSQTPVPPADGPQPQMPSDEPSAETPQPTETPAPDAGQAPADAPTDSAAQVAPIPDEVREYLDSLLQDAGMTGFDPAMHDAMIAELYVRLDKFLIGKVVEFLPEDKLEEFAKLNEEASDPQKIQEYLTANLPNAQDVFTQAFGQFRDIYLEGVKNAVAAQDTTQPATTAN